MQFHRRPQPTRESRAGMAAPRQYHDHSTQMTVPVAGSAARPTIPVACIAHRSALTPRPPLPSPPRWSSSPTPLTASPPSPAAKRQTRRSAPSALVTKNMEQKRRAKRQNTYRCDRQSLRRGWRPRSPTYPPRQRRRRPRQQRPLRVHALLRRPTPLPPPPLRSRQVSRRAGRQAGRVSKRAAGRREGGSL